MKQRVFDLTSFHKPGTKPFRPHYVSGHGALFSGDCLSVLPQIRSRSIDTVFADPPFNLRKEYGANCSDNMGEAEYLAWCKSWLRECHRVLKPGGALFVYNLPKWNVYLGAYLGLKLGAEFRHWIAVSLTNGLPIPKRLYPSHYSLLYYTKGKAKTFNTVRTPIPLCRHCGGEIKDYGGHRKELNAAGLNLKDVWTDVSPVCHAKFKDHKGRRANALSTKLLERVVNISTCPGDVVLDPFGGSGTTFAVCEALGRGWIGVEIDFAGVIVERLRGGRIGFHPNDDFVTRKVVRRR